ncbi:pyrroline-5-carboxylate reductase [Actibacterium sp. 188UL27-1]|uniref:pyrroline-5-carboxylate reductase n=1 Tax=Actibacterium sp. 188UL27-1 TaxID=2786961 RepID=UPI00195E27A7|nr:pyrroline-5-carboxylate reductase [Actibacterium sp. 188UL27-1]MBM7066514.1 pyrroline-5-carboxylate reductase [Actibacterium sp. 188UL27-1]
MDRAELQERGIVLLGCGKMGSAMLAGWLADGLSAAAVTVVDPKPSDWVKGTGVSVNGPLPISPALVLVAVKPQMMGDALPSLAALGDGDTLFLSVAAGTSIATYEAILGADTPIIRAMPNTPAAVGRGITAIIGNAKADDAHISMATELLTAIGTVVRLDHEAQIDAVTGVSGSGPAYVFHLIEALAAAGEAEGLPPTLAMKLAKATVAGAGELARLSEEPVAQLRVNVTSPQGTTAAGLAQLMDPDRGLPPLMVRTVKAAADRSRALSQ